MKKYVLVAVVLLLITVPASVMGQEGGTGDTIIMRSGGNVTTFNPLLWTDGGSFAAGELLWPTLFDLDRFTGLPVPGLSSWTISDDGLTYTFTIRDDAVWSDGTPISSADAKFVIDAIKATTESPRQPNVRRVKEVNIVDDKTFDIVFTQVYCTVWQDIANFRLLPSHKMAADLSDFANGDFINNPDISGGPYIMVEHRRDEFTRFKANPTFWRGQPKIPFWVNRIMGETSVMLQALQAGEIDYASLRGDELEQLTDPSQFHILSFPQNNTGLFFMNWVDPTNPQPAYDANGSPVEQTPHPIFSDIKVRQAVAQGYDKDDILATLGENGGTRLVGSVVPAITWAFNTEIQPWVYNPDAAAALLDEAGWTLNASTGIREKDGKPLAFTITYSPFFAYFETNALVAQDQLGQLGMDITLNEMEWAAYLNDSLVAQKFDASIVSFGGGSPPDPHNIAQAILYSRNDVPGSGFNVTSYVNPEYDALIDQGLAVPGCATEDRKPIYDQIQQMQHDQVAIDFTISPNLFQVMNNRVGNFNPGPWWTIGQTAEEYVFGG